MIVNTGHGLQRYWLLSTDVGARLGAELQAGLDARLAELELVNERSDLASVMRLPGTLNVKAEPVLVTIERAGLDAAVHAAVPRQAAAQGSARHER